MTVSDGLPTYEPVTEGVTQLSEFPAAPQFGVESATSQPQMVYMAQSGSGFPANVQVVHVVQPPQEQDSQVHVYVAIAVFILGFFVPLAWLCGLFLWNSPNQTAKIMGRISVLLFGVSCCILIVFLCLYFGFILLLIGLAAHYP